RVAVDEDEIFAAGGQCTQVPAPRLSPAVVVLADVAKVDGKQPLPPFDDGGGRWSGAIVSHDDRAVPVDRFRKRAQHQLDRRGPFVRRYHDAQALRVSWAHADEEERKGDASAMTSSPRRYFSCFQPDPAARRASCRGSPAGRPATRRTTRSAVPRAPRLYV